MNVSHYLFNAEQLNRLFPYYILLNKELKLELCGTAYAKLITVSNRDSFTNLFVVEGKPGLDAKNIIELAGKVIIISPLANPSLRIEGHFEYLKHSNQYLFAGNTILGADHPQVKNTTVDIKDKLDFFEQVLNEVPADIVVFDTEHRYLFINKAAIKDPALRKRMIGLKDEDFCWLTNRPESIATHRREQFNAVMRSKKIMTWEETMFAKDGSVHYMLRNLYPLLDETGEVKLMIGYGLEITDRREVEQQLSENEKKYRDLYNLSPALIFTHDLDGIITSFNPAIERLLGYNPSEVVRKNLSILLPERERENLHTDYLEKLKSDGKAKGVFKAVHSNGNDRVYLSYQSYFVNNENDSPYVIGFSHDISDRIKIEQELRAAKIATEGAARTKEIFLANISHEIRTPMNGIIGLNNLLAKTDLTEQQRGYSKLIAESADNLVTIINDILDIEKITANQLELESRPFNISNKISRTMQLFQYKARQKNVDLVLKSRLPEDFVVIGDEGRFAQILSNLLSNAIKFTKQGSVTVSAALLYNANEKVLLEFSVTDTGIGIGSDILPHIFEPFIRTATYNVRKHGGAGMGLSIVKSLVEMQGGHIKVNSKEQVGTEFVFSLTYKKGLAYMQRGTSNQVGISPDRLRNKRVLVAEDVELNQYLVRTLLESWGCVVDVVADGKAAVEQATDTAYDIILMDIQMPEMDGITATQLIRQLRDNHQASVPIIALTANALRGDSKYYFNAGMDDCVTKPYTEEHLYEKIVKALAKDRTEPVKDIIIPASASAAEALTEKIEEAKQPNEQPQPEPAAKLYDLSIIESISKNNQDFVNKMIVMFCDITGQDMNKIHEAAEKEDWNAVGQLAHKLKSTVGNMGVETLREPLRLLEHKEATDPNAIIAELDKEFELVKQQLRADYPAAFAPKA